MTQHEDSEQSRDEAPVTLRCTGCGNRTRFDVYESVRRRRYHHYTLGGDLAIDEEETLERTIERVVCRWCGRSDLIERLGDANQVER